MSIEAVAVKCAAFELNQSSAEIRRADRAHRNGRAVGLVVAAESARPRHHHVHAFVFKVLQHVVMPGDVVRAVCLQHRQQALDEQRGRSVLARGVPVDTMQSNTQA